MTLFFPHDLESWRSWQSRRNRLRWLTSALASRRPAAVTLLTGRQDPEILLVCDGSTPGAIRRVVEPLLHLSDLSVAIIAPTDVSASLPGQWEASPIDADAQTTVPRSLRAVRAVVSSGHYLPEGAVGFRWARSIGAEFIVVQHGLMTPFAPPLPPRSTLLAFSAADAEFWISGRPDVTGIVVGSQMLWRAAHHPVGADSSGLPVFLGQLHGAELPRRISVRTAESFCRATGATYRPHPAETDVRSRMQHQWWHRRGIDVRSEGSLLTVGRPVVAVFSTGVLEAAVAGLPAWVTCVDPPSWVREFWYRYQLSPWGNEPTAKPAVPPVEPAKSIAQRVREIVTA